jgi:hypothetical protein
MNPFELFESFEVYKLVMLYLSRSRGVAIVGRRANEDKVEVIQLTGEVDPNTGNFTALDYTMEDGKPSPPLISKRDFEKLVSYLENTIDQRTPMSVIEPAVMRAVNWRCAAMGPCEYVH